MTILRRLNFPEKVNFARKTHLIPDNVAKWLHKLNTVRNHCAHDFFLQGDKEALRYEERSILTLRAFRSFAAREYEVEDFLVDRIFGHL